jgi:hypothetical protein
MKNTYILLVLLFTVTMIGCDKDECPVCHECACVCQKVASDSDECSVCHECECVCPPVGNVNDTTVNSPGQVVDFSDTLKSGTWYITYFLEDGETETSDYNGYSFSFSDSGNVSVSILSTSATITGNWRIRSDSGLKELYLDFTHPGKFKELNDDWDVIELTGEIIRLKDHCNDSCNGSCNDSCIDGLDYLTFYKNL